MAREGEVGWLLPISVDQHSNHGLRTRTSSEPFLLFNLGLWVFEIHNVQSIIYLSVYFTPVRFRVLAAASVSWW